MNSANYYRGPGLVDLQINGFKGVDFNSPGLNEDSLIFVAESLRELGIVKFLPTLITNDINFLEQQIGVIQKACASNQILSDSIAGIHLEGPFISSHPGAIGAHPLEHAQQPNSDSLMRLWESSKGMIKILTLAPELEGALSTIETCRDLGIVTAIGHSLADSHTIENAIQSGMSFSTHLGNALPMQLERFDNALYAQLNADRLGCSLVYDGHHLSKTLMQIILKLKDDKAFLVSDSTSFAGLKPGVYETVIGGKVYLSSDGRLSMVKNNMLAGSSASLLDCVLKAIEDGVIEPRQAWEMASIKPASLLGLPKGDIEEVEIELNMGAVSC